MYITLVSGALLSLVKFPVVSHSSEGNDYFLFSTFAQHKNNGHVGVGSAVSYPAYPIIAAGRVSS